MKDDKFNNKEFFEWLNDIGDFIPNLRKLIYILIQNLESGYSFKFFSDNIEYGICSWDEGRKIININSNAPTILMIEDLVNVLCDANNSYHKLALYNNFDNGENYAQQKIKIQYLSFFISYQMLSHYIDMNFDETEKLHQSEYQFIKWCEEIHNNSYLSFSDYFKERKENEDFFINDWNNWYIEQLKINDQQYLGDHDNMQL